MADLLSRIFLDEGLADRIRRKLPCMFKIAEMDVSRGGKVGMEVGVLREQIIIALLMYKFGKDNVITNIPANEPQTDVKLKGHDNPISIKTKTGSGFSGVKLIWTVDWEMVERFSKSYYPNHDTLFISVNWGKSGVFAYIPLNVHREIFERLGRSSYIKQPKKGTNPRGVEISSTALKLCLEHTHTKKISIIWKCNSVIKYSPYDRWVKLWAD